MEIIAALAIKQIDLATSVEELNQIQKHYDKYFAALNKFIAIGGPVPYINPNGVISYDA